MGHVGEGTVPRPERKSNILLLKGRVRRSDTQQEGQGWLPASQERGWRKANLLRPQSQTSRPLSTWFLWQPGLIRAGYHIHSRWMLGGLCEWGWSPSSSTKEAVLRESYLSHFLLVPLSFLDQGRLAGSQHPDLCSQGL